MNDFEITLTLTLAEVNAILTSLGKLPFDQVSGLITKVREQAVPQLPAEQQAE